MVAKNGNVFLQALIATIIIFGIGVVLGFALENSRTDKTQLALINSEIGLLDEQVRSRNIEIFNIGCELERKSTFNFADRIYKEAFQLEEYDASSKFTNELKILHKKYDLLRVMLWTRTIEIQEQCPQKYHTIVYLFDYASEDINQKAKQLSISRLLIDFKEKHGDSILLIPIASNLELESVNLILEKYGILERPALIIDKDKIIKKEVTYEELENIVFEKNNFEQIEGIIYEKVNLNKPEKIILNPNK